MLHALSCQHCHTQHVNGTRQRETPRKRWLDKIQDDSTVKGLSLSSAERLANDQCLEVCRMQFAPPAGGNCAVIIMVSKKKSVFSGTPRRLFGQRLFCTRDVTKVKCSQILYIHRPTVSTYKSTLSRLSRALFQL